MPDNIKTSIDRLKKTIMHPEMGLGDEMFLYVSSITPIVNVDLLFQREDGAILLAWREDDFGTGWHIPGGVIRFKETFEERLQKTALNEIGTNISFDKMPCAINEIILPQNTRGHFISFLYKCYFPVNFSVNEDNMFEHKQGELKWFIACPEDFLEVQRKIYGCYFTR